MQNQKELIESVARMVDAALGQKPGTKLTHAWVIILADISEGKRENEALVMCNVEPLIAGSMLSQALLGMSENDAEKYLVVGDN